VLDQDTTKKGFQFGSLFFVIDQTPSDARIILSLCL